MAASHNYYSRPQMGATFQPGTVDDHRMPEVISPAPQRFVALFFSPAFSFAVAFLPPYRPFDWA